MLILLFGTPIALYKAETNITKHKNKNKIMKKFTISAIMAMGVVVLSSAAFAGTTSVNYRGIASGSALAADTVVPNDTVVPEQKDTVKTETDPVQFALNDTIVPEQKDTVKSEPVKTEPVQFALNDTVVPEQKDTAAPKK